MSLISPASVRRQRISAVLEGTPGTTPTSPAFNILPIETGFAMQVKKQFSQSKLIRADREPGAIVGGVNSVEGRIPMPLVREAGMRMFMESALGGTFTAVALTVAVAWNSGAKTATRASGSFLTEPIANRPRIGDTLFPAGTSSNQSTLSSGIDAVVTTIPVTSVTPYNAAGGVVKIASTGEIIKYTSASGGNLNGCTRGWSGTTPASALSGVVALPGRTITNISALVLTFANDSGIQTEASVSTTFTANTKVLIPGVVRKYYSIDQYFADIDTYRLFPGVETNTMQVRIPTSDQVSLEFGVNGLGYGTTQAPSSTYAATAGASPAAGSQAGSSLLVDGVAFDSCIESIDVNLNNNRAGRYGVGSAFPCFIGEGDRQMDVNFAYYLVNNAMQAKFQNETRIALEVLTVAGIASGYTTGDKYRFNWPRLVLKSADTGESNESVSETASASAEIDTTSGVNTSFFVHEIAAI